MTTTGSTNTTNEFDVTVLVRFETIRVVVVVNFEWHLHSELSVNRESRDLFSFFLFEVAQQWLQPDLAVESSGAQLEQAQGSNASTSIPQTHVDIHPKLGRTSDVVKQTIKNREKIDMLFGGLGKPNKAESYRAQELIIQA